MLPIVNRSKPSRRSSSVDEMDLNTSMNNKRKRNSVELDHGGRPAKKSRQKISVMEQKLLKFHGIKSEARVNLRRVSPSDIKIFCQKYVLECKTSDSSSNSDNSSNDSKYRPKTIHIKDLENNKQFCNLKNVRINLGRSKGLVEDCSDSSDKNTLNLINLKKSVIVNSGKNLDVTEKCQLVTDNGENITDNPDDPDDMRESSVCNKESLRDIRHNSLLQVPLKPLPPTNPVADKDDLKDVRLNTIKINNTCSSNKQENIVNNVVNKPLIILDVDKINKRVSTECEEESTKVDNLNYNEKNLPSLKEKSDLLKLKPPPIREFTLKDFGLDKASKNLNAPSTSKSLSNNLDKYLREKFLAIRNDSSRYNEPKPVSVTPLNEPKPVLVTRFNEPKPVSVTQLNEPKSVSVNNNETSKEDKAKKYSLEELGLANRRVRTLGLKDFSEPNSLVFGVKDFKTRIPVQENLENKEDIFKRSLRNFRLGCLKDVKSQQSSSMSETNTSVEERAEISSSSKNGNATEELVSETTSEFNLENRDATSNENDEILFEPVMISDENLETNNSDAFDTTISHEASKTPDSEDPLMIDSNQNQSIETNTSTVDDPPNFMSANIISSSNKQVDNSDGQREVDKNNLSTIQELSSLDNSICEVQANTNSLSDKESINNNVNELIGSSDTLNSRADIVLNSNTSNIQSETTLESSVIHDSALMNTGLSAQKEVFSNNISKDLDKLDNSIDNPDTISKCDRSSSVSQSSFETLNNNKSETNEHIPNCEAEITALSCIANSKERIAENSVDKKDTCVDNKTKTPSITNEEIKDGSKPKNDIDNSKKCDVAPIQTLLEIKKPNVNSNKLETVNDTTEVKTTDVSKNEVTTVFNGSKKVLANHINNRTVSSDIPNLSLIGIINAQIHKSVRDVENGSDVCRNSDNIKNDEKVKSRNDDEALSDIDIHEESFSEVCTFDDDDDDDDIEIIETPDLNSGKNSEGESRKSNILQSHGKKIASTLGSSSALSSSANIDQDLEIIEENYVKKTSDDQVILIEPEQNLTSSFKNAEGLGINKINIREKNDDLSPMVKRLKSNDYSIKKLFLPSKKNNSTFISSNISNLSRQSNNFKENSFRKDERIEDCSYDYPKFSVLDTEGLMHSYRNLVCGSCFKHVNVKFTNKMGTSGTEFEVECFSCKHIRRFKRSKSSVNEVDFTITGYDNLYLKLVYSCLDFGGGYNQLQSTCLALNIPHLNKKAYDKYCSFIISQSETNLNTILMAASEIVHNAYENKGICASVEGIREINILIDSWIPKGKRKKYCLVVAIDLLTGLVLDFYLFVNYCRSCCIMRKKKNFESWKFNHKILGQCHINWNVNDENLESEASRILCSRSEQKYKFKYSFDTSDTSNVLRLPDNTGVENLSQNTTNINSLNSEIEKKQTIENPINCHLNISDPVLGNENNENNYIESDDISNSLERKEMSVNVSTINEIYSHTEIPNIANNNDNSEEGSVLHSSTPEKVSVDSCDSNGALEIQSTSGQLTLTNINSINNGDSDKELQEFNKSPNHILEEIKIDLDLDSVVPSVTSSDTLSEGLLDSNGVLVHQDDISLTNNVPLPIGVMDRLENQCNSNEISNADISQTSPANEILMMDMELVSGNNKELSNVIQEDVIGENDVSSVCQKSDVSEKVNNSNDSMTTVSKQLTSVVNVNEELVTKDLVEQSTSTKDNIPISKSLLKVDSVEVEPIIVNNDKLNNSMTYDEHREMASLLASNVVDQDASTDFEKSVTKENEVSNIKDDTLNLEEDMSINNESFKSLLNEESGERCTINKVSELLTDDVSMNETSDNPCVASLSNKDKENKESDKVNHKKNESQFQEAADKVDNINKNAICLPENVNTINDKKDEKIANCVKKDKEIACSSDNKETSCLNSHNVKEFPNNSEKVLKMLKRIKKDSLRSSVLKSCNSSAPIMKELVEFACNQAIIVHNVNIENLNPDWSSNIT